MNIKSLCIENFKCFQKAEIDFGKITLLTGANSSGKSSLLSALLVMFQTENFPFYLSPNGSYISLGNYRNMATDYDINRNIKIDFDFDTENQTVSTFSTTWENNFINGLPALNLLKYAEENYDFIIEKLNDKYKIKISQYVENEIFDTIDDIIPNLIEKYGIPHYNEKPYIPLFLNHFFSKILSFNFIHSYRTNPQRNYLQIPKAGKIITNGGGFENQIVEWEETKSPKLNELINILFKMGLINEIKSNKIGDGMFDIKVQTKKNGVFSSLADVGYGVSKLLPIIVADLQLPDNSLLAISEPEIDLHPSVQANFANYIFEQTKKGKQYIIETHSEYIINRLRLLIAKNELQEDEVKTYFFSNDGRNTTTYTINLKNDGQIENAPSEFFDTYEVDIMEIAMQG